MPNDSAAIIYKVWNFAHVLKNTGVGLVELPTLRLRVETVHMLDSESKK